MDRKELIFKQLNKLEIPHDVIEELQKHYNERLQSELSNMHIVIALLVQRLGGEVFIPIHEMIELDGVLHSSVDRNLVNPNGTIGNVCLWVTPKETDESSTEGL